MCADGFTRLPLADALVEDEPAPTARPAAAGAPTTSLIAFIVGLSRLLAEGAAVDTLLKQSLAGLVKALPGLPCASVYLKQERSDRLSLAAQYHQCAADGLARRPRPDLAAQVVEYVKPITLMVRPAADGPFSPILGLPISVAGNVLGALIIEAAVPVYSEGDTALLNLVVAQLALVIENRRLRQQVAALGGLQLPISDEQFAI